MQARHPPDFLLARSTFYVVGMLVSTCCQNEELTGMGDVRDAIFKPIQYFSMNCNRLG